VLPRLSTLHSRVDVTSRAAARECDPGDASVFDQCGRSMRRCLDLICQSYRQSARGASDETELWPTGSARRGRHAGRCGARGWCGARGAQPVTRQ